MDFVGIKNMDINLIDPNNLVDIDTILIDESLPKSDRIKDYISKVKNPYCFKCEGVTVMVDFVDENRTLEECLVQYIRSKIE